MIAQQHRKCVQNELTVIAFQLILLSVRFIPRWFTKSVPFCFCWHQFSMESNFCWLHSPASVEKSEFCVKNLNGTTSTTIKEIGKYGDCNWSWKSIWFNFEVHSVLSWLCSLCRKTTRKAHTHVQLANISKLEQTQEDSSIKGGVTDPSVSK